MALVTPCEALAGLAAYNRHNPTPDASSRETLIDFFLAETAYDHSELGHRSLAPATFFEVRFAGLFEARRRLPTSAT